MVTSKIYSHMDIDEVNLNRKFETILDTGDKHEYSIKYQTKYVVNMPYIGQGKGKGKGNKCGWLRDKNYFFKHLLEENPEIFSEENKFEIMNGDSPLVDNTFISFFPEYSDFISEKLFHHHIGEDGQAVALPTSLHKGYGVVHNSEKIIGVTENGINFSNHIQGDFIAGKTFEWSNAKNIMDEVHINKLCYGVIDEKINISLEDTNPIMIENTGKSYKRVNLKSRWDFLKNIKPTHIVIGVLTISATAATVIATKKAGSPRKLFKNIIDFVGNNLEAGDPFIREAIAGTAGTVDFIENIGNVAVAVSEVCKNNMDEISAYKTILDMMKAGSITLIEFIKEAELIEKVTKKKVLNYLRSLVNLHGDSFAAELINTLNDSK